MIAEKLNKLRAGVLGANDGIVSVSGVIAGFLGATHNAAVIITAGLLTLIAGAVSMGAGEYVSVAAQNDSHYSNEHNVGSPWGAVMSSVLSFAAGGIIPLIALIIHASMASVVVASSLALIATGIVSARVSGGHVGTAVRRNLLCGAVALALTYVVGILVG